MPKIAVIIPARNEADNIQRVIQDIIRNAPQCDIIVVDDHSTDETAQNACRHDRVTVLCSPIRLGIGGAVQLGVLHAMEKGYDIFVRMDGDGQHSALYVQHLLSKVQDTSLIIGGRSGHDFAVSSDLFREIGSRYFKFLFRVFTGKKISDPTSGFVCFGKSIAEKFARYFPLDFPEIESTVLLLRAGFDVKSEEVTMNPRKKGNSSITMFYSIVYMFSVSISFFIAFFKKNPYKR
jgi:glycosyltransferase involved in cell wall biosynthesis